MTLYISDPNTFKLYDIYSYTGKLLLKKYIRAYQNGGMQQQQEEEQQEEEQQEEQRISNALDTSVDSEDSHISDTKSQQKHKRKHKRKHNKPRTDEPNTREQLEDRLKQQLMQEIRDENNQEQEETQEKLTPMQKKEEVKHFLKIYGKCPNKLNWQIDDTRTIFEEKRIACTGCAHKLRESQVKDYLKKNNYEITWDDIYMFAKGNGKNTCMHTL